jgi:hypothetical protein
LAVAADKPRPLLSGMTTRIAIVLMLCIIAFFVLDHYVFQMDAAVFVGTKGIQLLNYVAFWR